MRHSPRFRLVLSSICLVTAWAAAGEPAIEAAFSLPDQTQVMNYVACEDALFASVRYNGELVPSHRDHGRIRPPPMVPSQRSALACWELDGRLRWRVDLPFAYQLVRAGNVMALAYDDGTLRSERGLILLDAASGKELRRTILEGRPCRMQYYADAKRLVLIIMPQHRVESIEGSWMETVAYDLDGKLSWRWKATCSELRAFSMDGRVLAVGSSSGLAGVTPFVARLDPATGKERWRQPWKFNDPPGANVQFKDPPRTLENLILVPDREGAAFLDADSGELRHHPVLPEMPGRTVHRISHTDRFYLTSNDLKGITLAGIDFPSGKLLWADETGTVSYGNGIAWGPLTVFMARRLSEGLTGRLALTELRIYARDGRLLAHLPPAQEREEGSTRWDDLPPPQAVGNRLYVSQGVRIVALGPPPAP